MTTAIFRRSKIERHGYCSGGIAPEYSVWTSMKTRCLNPHCPSYERYGKKGITVCEKWINSFTQFLSDVGRKPYPKYTLERINNNLGYFPGNVKWADASTNQNNRNNNRRIKYDGVVKTVTQWERQFGFPKGFIRVRLKRMSMGNAIALKKYERLPPQS